MALKTTIQFRRDHLSAWQKFDPTLAAGEIALVDLNNGNAELGQKWVVRIGDGVTPFNQLPETAYALSSDVAALASELTDQISSVISAHEADIAAIQSQIANDVAAQISSVISSHEADVEALQKAIEDGLSGNSEALAEAKEELNGAIDSAKTELSQALSTADANLSAGINAVKGELTALIDGVEDKVENKIKVGEVEGEGTPIDTLTIRRVSAQEYHNLVVEADKNNTTLPSDTLYIVSSDTINAFGERIENVGDATELSDAVNLKQLNAVSAALQGKIDEIGNIADVGIGELVSDVNDIISVSIPKLEGDISNVAADVATLSNETIPALDGKIDGVASIVNTISGTTIPALEQEVENLEASLTAYQITVSTSTDDTSRLKSWTFTQGETEIAKVEVPFDVFVDTGRVVEHDGETCLELTLKDGSVVHIPVTKLVDVYTGGTTDTVAVTVGEDFVISAEVLDGSITPAKLSESEVFVFDCGGAEG